jgi:5,10-methenyltetrahydrofolate synthetase
LAAARHHAPEEEKMAADDDEPAGFASPACLAHEASPGYMGLPQPGGPALAAWRKAERERLIGLRLAMPQAGRQAASEAIAARLAAHIGPLSGRRVSFYWPFRGEPDLRPLAETVWAEGGEALLPVVVAKAAPLVFRRWRSGEPLEKGVWNIPVPAGGEAVEPDIVIAPVVGYDPACYRLGYGGGFFDRTLAALSGRAVAIGVGYDLQRIATIRPQPYDIPMSAVVTETGTLTPVRILG